MKMNFTTFIVLKDEQLMFSRDDQLISLRDEYDCKSSTGPINCFKR